ncbi:MAG: hypothetical protein EHM84_06085 [Lysobacterales bacterium]|nr:MAG: hypothetical protein EHM84_06085 [Xanthomonadales bacterium]
MGSRPEPPPRVISRTWRRPIPLAPSGAPRSPVDRQIAGRFIKFRQSVASTSRPRSVRLIAGAGPFSSRPSARAPRTALPARKCGDRSIRRRRSSGASPIPYPPRQRRLAGRGS